MRNVYIVGFLALVLVVAGCSSGSNNSQNNFGPLGSTHRHVDIKIYLLGNPLDFSISSGTISNNSDSRGDRPEVRQALCLAVT